MTKDKLPMPAPQILESSGNYILVKGKIPEIFDQTYAKYRTGACATKAKVLMPPTIKGAPITHSVVMTKVLTEYDGDECTKLEFYPAQNVINAAIAATYDAGGFIHAICDLDDNAIDDIAESVIKESPHVHTKLCENIINCAMQAAMYLIAVLPSIIDGTFGIS